MAQRLAKLAKLLVPYAISLGAIAILFEVLAALFIFVDDGQLPYAGPTESESGISVPGLRVAEAVFHPYAGYVLRPTREGGYLNDTQWRANNRGIHNLVGSDGEACCDYPYEPADDEIIVGVFGGSVGSGFALSAQMAGTFDQLADHAPWKGKRIRVLSFALPGFKQPQQLMTLAYFLNLGQHFDVVINIDGFNEAVTTFKNWDSGVEPTYPADSLWGAWGRQLDQAGVADGRLVMLSDYHRLTADVVAYEAAHTRLASLKLFRKGLAGWHRWRSQRNAVNAPAELKTTGYFPTAMSSPLPDGQDIWGYTAITWAQASRSMDILARDSGALYLHILQPNQWDAEIAPYTPIDPNHPYDWVIEPVNSVYPLFRREGAGLVSRGVAFVDMSAIFADADFQNAYVDDCCHYTQPGNELIFEATIGELADLAAQSD